MHNLFDQNGLVTYRRNPTPYELKFGYGAIHYRDFEPAQCYHPKPDKGGRKRLKRWFKAKDDGLRYYR